MSGYLGVVTLDSEDISAIAHVTRLNRTRTGLPKRTFGLRYAYAIGGQREFAFSATGSITAEQAAAIDGLWEADVPISFSLQIGEGAAATDAGAYAGLCVITSLNIDGSADGQWEFTIDAIGTGEPVYTAAV